MKHTDLKQLFMVGICLLLVGYIYRYWFTPHLVYGGDHFFPPFPVMVENLAKSTYAWDPVKANGLGGVSLATLWIDSYAQILPNALQSIGIPGTITQKIVFTWAFLGIGFFGIWFLSRILFPKIVSFRWLSSVFYMTNTYILMVMSGGQFGIGMAYAIAPLVLGLAIICLRKIRSYFPWLLSYLLGISIAVQIFFDLRLAYITLWMIVGIVMFSVVLEDAKQIIRRLGVAIVAVGVFPLTVAFLCHAFWLIPLLIYKVNPAEQLGAAYTSTDAVRFFSFADFSHAFAWLHPNWPENIFGKTYFLRPLFLVIPLVIFSALWFIHLSRQQMERYSIRIYMVMFLAIIGVFLSKGSQEPFGVIYLWLFNNLPGFFLFRDPTKFYVVISIAYALLIPVSLTLLIRSVDRLTIRYPVFRKSGTLSVFVLGMVIIGWVFLIKEAYMGEISGTFTHKNIPTEYTAFQIFLSKEQDFSRTLWVPRHQYAAYFDQNHPLVDADALVGTHEINTIVSYLEQEDTENTLRYLGIRYVVIPYDSEQQIFVTDRTYDEQLYDSVRTRMYKIPWLSAVGDFGKLHVFEIKDVYSLFSVDADLKNTPLRYTKINPTTFTLEIPAGTDVVRFNQQYSNLWYMESETGTTQAQKEMYGQMYFRPGNVTGLVTVHFEPQRLLEKTLRYSWFGLVVLGIFVLLKHRENLV